MAKGKAARGVVDQLAQRELGALTPVRDWVPILQLAILVPALHQILVVGCACIARCTFGDYS